MLADEALVVAAHEAYFGAFSKSDPSPMGTIWARGTEGTCIPPGWEALHGRGEVMASFQAILASPNAPPIKAARASVTLLGQTAFIVCTESIDGTELVATNLFVLEDGAWKLALHHAGPVARRNEPPRKTPKSALN